MADMMQQLGLEHRNMSRLLNVLEQQLAIFERGDEPDYGIMTAIADYFVGFPDRCHHPKEDLILRRMRERDAEKAAAVGDLEAEHREIGERARLFHDTVHQVTGDAELPRDAFVATTHGFIEEQRAHMDRERSGFFLWAEAVLTDEDWQDLNASAEARESDPAFGGSIAKEYEALREQIMAWQEEDDAASLS